MKSEVVQALMRVLAAIVKFDLVWFLVNLKIAIG